VRTIEVKNRTSGCRPRSPPSAINRPAGARLARSRTELAMSLTDTSSGGSPGSPGAWAWMTGERPKR